MARVIIRFLQRLAEGDGALGTLSGVSSDLCEAAIVFARQAWLNSHPPHPDDPGPFTCEADSQHTPRAAGTGGPPTSTIEPSARRIYLPVSVR